MITSAIDGYWSRLGFDDDQIFEMKGSVNYFQCSMPCRSRLWKVDTLNIDDVEKCLQLRSGPPLCGLCKRNFSRPNVFMESDCYFVSSRIVHQEQRLNELCITNYDKKVLFAIVGVSIDNNRIFEVIKKKLLLLTNVSILLIDPKAVEIKDKLQIFLNNPQELNWILISMPVLEGLVTLNRHVRLLQYGEQQADTGN